MRYKGSPPPHACCCITDTCYVELTSIWYVGAGLDGWDAVDNVKATHHRGDGGDMRGGVWDGGTREPGPRQSAKNASGTHVGHPAANRNERTPNTD